MAIFLFSQFYAQNFSLSQPMLCCRPYYKAIVYCLTRKPYSTRKFTQMAVKRILSLLGGTAIALALVDVLGEILATQKVSGFPGYREIKKVFMQLRWLLG